MRPVQFGGIYAHERNDAFGARYLGARDIESANILFFYSTVLINFLAGTALNFAIML